MIKNKPSFILLFSLIVSALFLSGCSGHSLSSDSGTTVESTVPDLNIGDVTQPDSVMIQAEETLYNANNLVVKTDSVDSDYDSTYIIVSIQNNNDYPISLTCERSSVNGYMIDNTFSVDIDAESEIVTGITWSNTTLNLCDISKITDICFSLSAYAFDDYRFLFETEMMEVHTNLQGKSSQKINTEGTIIYDKNNIQLIAKGYAKDTEDNDVLVLMVINESADPLSIGILNDSAEIDGNECSSTFNRTLNAQSRAIYLIYFQDAEGNVISSSEETKVAFELINANTWKPIDDTAVITFKNIIPEESAAEEETVIETSLETEDPDIAPGTYTDDDLDAEVVPFNGVEFDPAYDAETTAIETFDIDVDD